MEQALRRRLLDLLRRSAGDEAMIEREFRRFVDEIRAMTVDRQPYVADIRDTLMWFCPSDRLAERLSKMYCASVLA